MDGKSIEEVSTFKYLGVTENKNADLQHELKRRILSMRIAFQTYKRRVFENSYLSVSCKLNFFVISILSVGLYGSALWSLTKRQVVKLEGFYLRFLKRTVPGVNLMSSYEEVILAAAKFNCVIIPIECYIIKRNLTFMGHIERLNPDEIQIQILHGTIDIPNSNNNSNKKTKCKIHGFSKNVKRNLTEFGINQINVEGQMQDRSKWRNTIINDGVCYFMSNLFKKRSAIRVKKHVNQTEAQIQYIIAMKTKLNIAIITEYDRQLLYDWEGTFKTWKDAYIKNLDKKSLNERNKEYPIQIIIQPEVNPVLSITQPTVVKINNYKKNYPAKSKYSLTMSLIQKIKNPSHQSRNIQNRIRNRNIRNLSNRNILDSNLNNTKSDEIYNDNVSNEIITCIRSNRTNDNNLAATNFISNMEIQVSRQVLTY